MASFTLQFHFYSFSPFIVTLLVVSLAIVMTLEYLDNGERNQYRLDFKHNYILLIFTNTDRKGKGNSGNMNEVEH